MSATARLGRGATLVAALGLVLAACAGGGSAASATPPPDADLTVSAQGNAFDRSELELPGGEATTVFFRNLDGWPHNVAVYRDAAATDAAFVGENVVDRAIVYELPALEPGEYLFRCDVHPDMQGTLRVEG